MFNDGLTGHAFLGMQCSNNYVNSDNELLLYIKLVWRSTVAYFNLLLSIISIPTLFEVN